MNFLPASLLVSALLIMTGGTRAQVVLNEVHYHPVEKAAFDATGEPVLDLSDDVHEFVEVHNAGSEAVDLSGWALAGGIDFTFPAGTTLGAGEYRAIAKNRARLAAVYGLATESVLGDFAGKLGNRGDTVRLRDASGKTVDAMSYSPSFPWPASADALGANDDFTGLDSMAYQYKGRSLQRVSAAAASNDPANWIAVRIANGALPFADSPTPGAGNLVTRAQPKPVVVAFSARQLADNAPTIRAGAQVLVTCSFSNIAGLSSVAVEYFVENMNAFGEARLTVPMTAGSNGQYNATLPGQANRTIIRYRIVADRGEGAETVSPRADDPAIVQVGPPTYQANPVRRFPAPREAWHSYFVSPVRSSVKPIYDVFVPTDGTATETYFKGLNGMQALAFNAHGSPKRTTAENPTGKPRELPYVAPTDRLWNDTVPGVFIADGVVRDIQIRYHGSRYNRNAGRRSFKVFFPEYLPYRDGAGNLVTSLFETDKSDFFMTAHGLHQLAGLPLSTVRYVDWHFNNDAQITRLEQGEYNGELLASYHEKMQRLRPGSALESTGEFYKAAGFIVSTNTAGEGPYGAANGWRLPASGGWSELQRFDYTYGLQNHNWKGPKPVRDLIEGMWNARGDNITSIGSASNPNLPNLRAWLEQNWDVQTELTSLAIGNWMCSWDDTTQNHFLWRRAPVQKPDGTFENSKWVRLLWDFDAMYGTGDTTSPTASIYLGEVGDRNNNYRGPNYLKDSFIKAFRAEFKERLWFLNNTLLEPENLQALTYGTASGGTNTYFTFINSHAGGFAIGRFNSVNSQCGLGIFYKPNRPINVGPTNAAAVLPGATLSGSAFGRSAAYTKAAAPDPSAHAASRWEIRAITSTYDYPAYVVTSTSDLTTLPIPFEQLTYGQTYLWRVTYFDAQGHPSITSAETSFSYGSTSTTAGDVVINEVLADNRGAITNGRTVPDYIELKNNTASDISLDGWSLTDDELLPNKYSFPVDSVVPAGGYLIVWCDSDILEPGLHTGFGLNSGGQRVILTQSQSVRDAVTFGPQAADLSVGRVADGTGAWTLNNPTPRLGNIAHGFDTNADGLKINEWMASPDTGDDWFELFNPSASPVALAGLFLSDTPSMPTLTKVPPLSFIATRGFTQFVANDGSGFNQAQFKLAEAGDSLVLTNTNGTTLLDMVSFGAQPVNVSQGRLPDGGATIVSFPQSPSPAESNYLPSAVVVNEVLSASSAPLEDAIELHNTTESPVAIGGWWLSDDLADPQKFQIPAGTTIAAGGFVVFYESQFNAAPGAGTSFSLDSSGDEVILFATDTSGLLTGYRSQQKLGAASDGVSLGRVVTSTGSDFFPQIARSFGEDTPTDLEQFRAGTGLRNSGPLIGPVVIDEVMYHPPELAGADNARDEFVELHNITDAPVDLSGWKLQGGTGFVLPVGTIIEPGGYIVLVGFDPADDATLQGFRDVYNSSSDVRVYGPYSPKLGNAGERIELLRPGATAGGETPLLLVDRLQFSDAAPWPSAADGHGPSLQRLSATAFGNDVVNWSARDATPGAPGTPILTAPALDSFIGNPTAVAFTLPHCAVSGSVKLIFANEANAWEFTLASSEESAGAHGFSFDPSNPTGTAAIASGPPLPDGTYSVRISFQDAPGNPVVTSPTVRNITLDRVGPVVTPPADLLVEATSPTGATVPYPGATASDPAGVASLIYSHASGGEFALGSTNVAVTARDSVNNASTVTFIVTVRDSTAPQITSPPATRTIAPRPDGTAAIPDLTGEVIALDAVGVTSVVQSPSAGTSLPMGIHEINFKVSDAAGNFSSVTSTVEVRVGRAAAVQTIAVRATGALAPGAGEPGGPPSGTQIAGFGTPALSDVRHLAARATLRNGRARLDSIYLEDAGGAAQLVAVEGSVPPGVPSTTFRSFGDPVVSETGSVAFGAKTRGGGVSSKSDEGVWTNAFGRQLTLVFREGSETPGVAGTFLSRVSSFSLRDGELLALLKLQQRRGTVSERNDTALVRTTATGTTLLLREGDAFELDSFPSTIKAISVLAPARGSPGHGRWHGSREVVAKVTLSDSREAVVTLNSAGTASTVAATGDASGAESNSAAWRSFRLPAVARDKSNIALHGTLLHSSGVTRRNDSALAASIEGAALRIFAREGDAAPGLPGSFFRTLYEPLINDSGAFAFLARFAGPGRGKDSAGIWWRAPEAALSLLARVGESPVDRSGRLVPGRTWRRFTSLALPGGPGAGPVFLAQLGGDVSRRDNEGCWSVDSAGLLRELIRTGDALPVGGQFKTVTGISLLNSARGVFGTTRSFNATGSIALRATFTDKSKALIRIDIP